ncbi:MAG: 4-(cytidine 5'-diphospho)-2-C-methyl-D-erythritol kinase [Elusimicrobiota bacterium]|jgi:4-diphosphocytidyl-2-C-methyl-D-erythritol kinase|nr:4-(cytidine 5'-diphospho)-2-C-methyl-D-erythritol kinase [Elusimicrobiota bacterium]
MTTEISVFAPAKINLFLEVIGKRQDGYHTLQTLFAKIALGDDIKISVDKAEKTTIELKTKGPFGKELKADNSNLAYKAAQAFFEHFDIKADCKIRLEKNIPIGSGLGGGSSDAAAVILALCSLFNIELNAKRLKDLVQLTAKLGADVPFFLHQDTFAKGEGIGDELTPIKSKINSPYIIVAYPGQPSNTKEVYSKVNLDSNEKILTNISSLNKLLEDVEKGSPLEEYGKLVYNKLEESVLPYMDSVAKLKQEMKAFGAQAVLMSGSGSCIFGLVDDKSLAEGIVRKISADNRTVFLTHFWRTKI